MRRACPPSVAPPRITPAVVCAAIAVVAIAGQTAAAAEGSPTPAPAPSPATPTPGGPDWGTMGMHLFGGLALFLFGMEQMAGGLKAAAGARVKDILARFTTNRVKAAATGATVTAIIQSSSVTTVLVVGFVSAGLMTLTQSVGVIFGANVGTTITAQIVAFKVEKAALGIIAVGFLMLFAGRRDRVVQLGNIIMGLGLVFFGMGVMSEAMSPLRTYEPFIGLMAGMGNPLLGILTGAAFTALVQSSSATTGVVIALASQGLLSLPAGISLIFGANIGTCVTALLASIGKSREARRVSLVHVAFNVVGVLLWVAFIPHLAELVEWISPKAAALTGTEQLAATVPRQVANAHAIFNISNTVLLLPFAGLLAKLVTRLVPDAPEKPVITPKFLDDDALQVPSVALNNARLEAARLGEIVCGMMDRLPAAYLKKSPGPLEAIARDDDTADALEGAILRYLGLLRQSDLSAEESADFQSVMMATNLFENIGDIIAEDLVAIGRKHLDADLHASDAAKEIIASLYRSTEDALADAVTAFRNRDPDLARLVLDRKGEINSQLRDAYHHQEERFRGANSDRLEVFRIEMGLVEKLRRIYSFTRRVAHTLEGAGDGAGDAAAGEGPAPTD